MEFDIAVVGNHGDVFKSMFYIYGENAEIPTGKPSSGVLLHSISNNKV